jgi:hypothetical protein
MTYFSNFSSCGRVRSRNIYIGSCSLQFAKDGSTATLPQQENSNSADVQRGGFIPRGDAPSTIFCRWPVLSSFAVSAPPPTHV